jgi:hypothetical protein
MKFLSDRWFGTLAPHDKLIIYPCQTHDLPVTTLFIYGLEPLGIDQA